MTDSSLDKIVLKKDVNNIMKHLQPYFDQGVQFHGILSPGLVLVFLMVDLAQELMGPRQLISAVVETKACLPDAIQLMTSCSYGNGWMRVKDWGKLALTLYDKYQLDGVRVYLDLVKVKNCPLIEQWSSRIVDIGCKEDVAREIMKAGRDILSWQRVNVTPYPKVKDAPLAVCSVCGETYPAADGTFCRRCSGKEDYYRADDSGAK